MPYSSPRVDSLLCGAEACGLSLALIGNVGKDSRVSLWLPRLPVAAHSTVHI